MIKDYYKVLEVEYDATDEKIRLNYRKLALVSNIYHLKQLFYGFYNWYLDTPPPPLDRNLLQVCIHIIYFPVCMQKWHPDKHGGDSAVTEKFQEINEAYKGDCL